MSYTKLTDEQQQQLNRAFLNNWSNIEESILPVFNSLLNNINLPTGEIFITRTTFKNDPDRTFATFMSRIMKIDDGWMKFFEALDKIGLGELKEKYWPFSFLSLSSSKVNNVLTYGEMPNAEIVKLKLEIDRLNQLLISEKDKFQNYLREVNSDNDQLNYRIITLQNENASLLERVKNCDNSNSNFNNIQSNFDGIDDISELKLIIRDLESENSMLKARLRDLSNNNMDYQIEVNALINENNKLKELNNDNYNTGKYNQQNTYYAPNKPQLNYLGIKEYIEPVFINILRDMKTIQGNGDAFDIYERFLDYPMAAVDLFLNRVDNLNLYNEFRSALIKNNLNDKIRQSFNY